MKNIKSWKVMSVMLVVCVFLSLYGFIYYETIKQPSKEWSRSIPIEIYMADLDMKDPDKRVSLTLSTGDMLIYITGTDNEVSFSTYNALGEKVESKDVHVHYPVTEINGDIEGDRIYLTAASPESGYLSFMEFDAKTFELISDEGYFTNAEDYQLGTRHATVIYDHIVEVYSRDVYRRYKSIEDMSVVLASTLIRDGEVYGIVILNDLGVNKLFALRDINGVVETQQFGTLSGTGTTQPTYLQVIHEKNRLKALVSMLDTRMNVTSLNIYSVYDNLSQAKLEMIDLFSYNGIPYYDSISGEYIIGIFDNNLGRTEVARGKSVYPNYYSTKDFNPSGYIQLTNTESIGRTPSLVRVDGYEYLIHNEYSEGFTTVYMTSKNPDVIEKSMSLGKYDLFEIFLRTIVNYPAILFSGILPTVSILLPVLSIGLPFMMLKLSWVEQNKSKTMLLMLGMYTISKLYVYSTDIFNAFESAKILPDYLASAAGHWAVLIAISAMTIMISVRRSYEVRHRNESFMKSMALYMLLDVTVLNLFFLPYTII